MRWSSCHCRIGFALVELLVVVAIIGVLIGILIPAIQQANEAARKAACQSNLKQFGVAMYNYHDSFRTFPAGWRNETGSFGMANAWSAHAQLLPYFEERNYGKYVDFNQSEWDMIAAGSLPPHLVQVFVCPSDTADIASDSNATSYSMNCGTWCRVNGWDGVFGPDTKTDVFGTFGKILAGRLSPVGIGQITDGLSTTAMMSEVIIGRTGIQGGLPGEAVSRFDGTLFGFNFHWLSADPDTTSLSTARADLLANPWQTANLVPFSPHGVPWTEGGAWATWYNHILPPNQPSWMFGWLFGGAIDEQVTSASSRHSGGVNVLMCSGAVHVIKDRIDPDVWSAFGSRRGGEQTELP